MTADARNHSLGDEDTWMCGPLLEVYIRFKSRNLAAIPIDRAQTLLDRLGIDGGYPDVRCIGKQSVKLADWRKRGVSYGQWMLAEDAQVGVKIIPVLDWGYPEDLLLCIPPEHVDRVFGEYPWWVKAGWVTPDVIRVHEALVARLRDLHAYMPVRTAMIQDEAWTKSLPGGVEGVLVSRDVGLACSLEGVVEDDMYRIPWPSEAWAEVDDDV